MAFRRQDIPRTTRKVADGELRRIYPRYLNARTLLPAIGQAVEWIDGMVGRRRGDLDEEALLTPFPEARLARCIVACLAGSHGYRTPFFEESVGADGDGAPCGSAVDRFGGAARNRASGGQRTAWWGG